jgi:hypothetical protein
VPSAVVPIGDTIPEKIRRTPFTQNASAPDAQRSVGNREQFRHQSRQMVSVRRETGEDMAQTVIDLAPLLLLTALAVEVIAGFLTLAVDHRGWWARSISGGVLASPERA